MHLARDHPPDVLAAAARLAAVGADRSWRLPPGRPGDDPDRPRRVRLGRIVGVHAAARRTAHWFSHESAALLWGLPLWRDPDARRTSSSGTPPAQPRPRRRGTTPSGRPEDAARCRRRPAGHVARADGRRLRVDATCGAGARRSPTQRSAPGRDRAALDDACWRAAPGRRGSTRARAVDRARRRRRRVAGRVGRALRRPARRSPVHRRRRSPVETRLGTFWADLGWEEWRLRRSSTTGAASTTDARRSEFMREKRRHDAVARGGLAESCASRRRTCAARRLDASRPAAAPRGSRTASAHAATSADHLATLPNSSPAPRLVASAELVQSRTRPSSTRARRVRRYARCGRRGRATGGRPVSPGAGGSGGSRSGRPPA